MEDGMRCGGGWLRCGNDSGTRLARHGRLVRGAGTVTGDAVDGIVGLYGVSQTPQVQYRIIPQVQPFYQSPPPNHHAIIIFPLLLLIHLPRSLAQRFRHGDTTPHILSPLTLLSSARVPLSYSLQFKTQDNKYAKSPTSGASCGL